MIYEFTTYRAREGATDRLIKRFDDMMMQFFARPGFEVVDCRTGDDEWIAAKAASEKNGPWLASQSTVLHKPADFPPAR